MKIGRRRKMNSLFVKKEKSEVAIAVKEEIITPITVEDEANAPIVRADETETTIEQSSVDFGQVMDRLAGADDEDTPVSLIKGLSRSEDQECQAKNMAMKAIIPHTGSYTAAQFLADWNDDLGMPQVSAALRGLCDWAYHHSCGFKGKRSEQAFTALAEEEQKEFLLQKEAKGLLQR